MNIPERVNAKWMSTLDDDSLVAAETQLHGEFRDLDLVERVRAKSRYVLLEGPAPLVNAWLRWLMVSNETKTRGLTVHHHPRVA